MDHGSWIMDHGSMALGCPAAAHLLSPMACVLGSPPLHALLALHLQALLPALRQTAACSLPLVRLLATRLTLFLSCHARLL